MYKRQVANAGTLHEAMRNLNQVANVVDPQRMKILFATALPVLSEAVGPDHPFAVINHVGQDKVNKLVAKLGPEQAAPEYANLVKNLGNSLFGVAQERNGANHLTYYIQTFNGRIAPQQTNFDPTSSKSVRFVTRNAVPAEAKPGSRIERNLRQMYAMMLVEKAGAYSLMHVRLHSREPLCDIRTVKDRILYFSLMQALCRVMLRAEPCLLYTSPSPRD